MELLIALLFCGCVVLFVCLVKTTMERNTATDALARYEGRMAAIGDQFDREVNALTNDRAKAQQSADYWMREAMALKGHLSPPAFTTPPPPSPKPWTHPGRN